MHWEKKKKSFCPHLSCNFGIACYIKIFQTLAIMKQPPKPINNNNNNNINNNNNNKNIKTINYCINI